MKRADLYYSETVRRTAEQVESRQHFNTTITALLAVSGLILSIMAFNSNAWVCWSVYPAVLVMVGFVGVATASGIALWSRNWLFQPALSALYKHMKSYGDEALTIWAAKGMHDAHRQNMSFLRRKAVCQRAALCSLFLEVVSLGLFVFSVSL